MRGLVRQIQPVLATRVLFLYMNHPRLRFRIVVKQFGGGSRSKRRDGRLRLCAGGENQNNGNESEFMQFASSYSISTIVGRLLPGASRGIVAKQLHQKHVAHANRAETSNRACERR